MDDQERNGWTTILAALRFRVRQHEQRVEESTPDEAAFVRGMRDALTVARDAVEASINADARNNTVAVTDRAERCQES